MIHVTCGHERSISLEVFFKSISHLNSSKKNKIILHIDEKSLTESLELLRIKKPNINYSFLSKIEKTLSSSSLLSALNQITKEDTLFTLPTSKDQIIYNNEQLNGHTELFRKFFKNEEISMCFRAPNSKLILITDHIKLQDVSKTITPELIHAKVSQYLNYDPSISNVYFAGINPHVGENGLMGNEDSNILKAIKLLTKSYPKIKFLKPVSGDILFQNQSDKNLLVSMFHDQGLAPFKLQNQFIGANISLGLPFLRFSPDHGTAFELYGKNIANYYGTLYSLNLALNNEVH